MLGSRNGLVRLPGAEVALRGVTRAYGAGSTAVWALAGVELSVAAGEFVALVGPSGSGKSTLLNLVCGLDTATGGGVEVGGRELGSLSRQERTRFRRVEVGFVFQRFHLVPVLTAWENVALVGQMAGRGQEAGAWLERLGLGAKAARFPGELSGGEQQRVAIARALVKAPRLVLADEPTGNLDGATGRAVVLALREASAALSCTVMMVTHDEALAGLADRVVRLRDGRVVGEARPAAGGGDGASC